MRIERSTVTRFFESVLATDETEARAEDFAPELPYLRGLLSDVYSPQSAEQVRLGLAYILAHPDIDWDWDGISCGYESGWYLGGTYELAEFLYKNLWPDQYPIPPETLLGVELDMDR